MDDVISRTAAMTIPVLPKEHRDYISFKLDDIYEQGWNECQSFIAKLPSADRPQGEWIEVDDVSISCWCSVCGWEAHLYEDDVYGMPYCPNCGADMRGE